MRLMWQKQMDAGSGDLSYFLVSARPGDQGGFADPSAQQFQLPSRREGSQ
jgi:hypothetical protein